MGRFEETERELYGFFKQAILSEGSTNNSLLEITATLDYFRCRLNQGGGRDISRVADGSGRSWPGAHVFWERLEAGDSFPQFSSFLMFVVLGKIALRLVSDPDLESVWGEAPSFFFDVAGFPETMPVYQYAEPAIGARQELIAEIADEADNRRLLLDLWVDQINLSARDFLTNLGFTVPNAVYPILKRLEKGLGVAREAHQSEDYEKIIETLEPLLEPLLGMPRPMTRSAVESACTFLAVACDELDDRENYLHWLQTGKEHFHEGLPALNFCVFYKNQEQFPQLCESATSLLVGRPTLPLFPSSFSQSHKWTKVALQYAFTGALETNDLPSAWKLAYEMIYRYPQGPASSFLSPVTDLVREYVEKGFSEGRPLLDWFESFASTRSYDESFLQSWWGALPDWLQTALFEELDRDHDDPVDVAFLRRVRSLTQLDVFDERSGEEIAKLVPGFPHLQRLDLSFSELEDLSFLESLIELHTLDLSNNPKIDLSTLPPLPNLRDLDLSACELTELSALKNCSALEELNLSENPLRDIEPLACLGMLEILNLSETLVTDFRPMLACPNLRRLDLHDVALKRQEGLDELVHQGRLRQLYSDTYMSDEGAQEVYAALPQLKEYEDHPGHSIPGYLIAPEYKSAEHRAEVLKCWNHLEKDAPLWADVLRALSYRETYEEQASLSVDDLIRCLYGYATIELPQNIDLGEPTFFERFSPTSVRHLEARNAGITSLAPLQSWRFLNTLIVSHNPLGHCHHLGGHQHLCRLDLTQCGLSSLEGLESCSSLVELTLAKNEITALSPLTELKNLRKLDLLSNPVTGVQELTALKSLRELRLGHPGLTLDLAPLTENRALESIVCLGSEVLNILALSELPGLRKLITASTASSEELAEFRRRRPEVLIT